MRFVVDESTGYSVVTQLRALGHDATAVADIMPAAKDADILAYAFREERIVITNDKDFGELIFRSQKPHHGVILLRLEDETGANRARVVTALVRQFGDDLTNQFTVASETRVRFRPNITGE